MSMSIYTKEGQKIVYANPKNGMPDDQHRASHHLTVNKEYEIIAIFRGDFRSEVMIAGHSGTFNTVMFNNKRK
jgi:hypothetical protein